MNGLKIRVMIGVDVLKNYDIAVFLCIECHSGFPEKKERVCCRVQGE